jgi:CRP-like cAMP-binding protein
MALLEDKPRLASAVAYEDCSVMTVNKGNFELMITSQPQLIAKVTSLLADRIWLIYRKLDNVRIADPMGRLYNTIYTQLEKNRIPFDGKNTPASFIFDFGWSELFAMTGLPVENNNALKLKISKNSKIQILENKIHLTSIMEIVRQTEYYRKMDRRDKQTKM